MAEVVVQGVPELQVGVPQEEVVVVQKVVEQQQGVPELQVDGHLEGAVAEQRVVEQQQGVPGLQVGVPQEEEVAEQRVWGLRQALEAQRVWGQGDLAAPVAVAWEQVLRMADLGAEGLQVLALVVTVPVAQLPDLVLNRRDPTEAGMVEFPVA